MKKAAYRYAVSTVRWDAEKRLSIEAALRQNVKAPEPVDDPDEAFIETDLLSMDDVMTEEDMRMERKRIRRNVLIAVLTAAVLGAGGITAAVAMQRRGGVQVDQTSSGAEDSRSAESQAERSAAEQTHTADRIVGEGFRLHLTDQQDEQGMRGYYPEECLTESEQGYYYLKKRDWDVGPRASERTYTMMFADKESDALVPLCNRPNCLHDGSEFCTATTLTYRLKTGPVWLDGYVYAVAKKPDDRGDIDGYGEGKIVLLRYEPDGTGITEAAEIMDSPADSASQSGRMRFGLEADEAKLIAHRGKLWYAAGVQELPSDGRALCGYRMGFYDPETGQGSTLLSADGQEYGFGGRSGFRALAGEGDYIYFSFDAKGRWDEPNKLRTGLWQLSCVNGGLTRLTETNDTPPDRFTVNGGKIFYPKQVEVRSGMDAEIYDDYMIYDTETRTETCIMRHTDDTGSFVTPTGHGLGIGGVVAAGRDAICFLMSDPNEFANGYDAVELWLYDWDGTLLKRAPLDPYLEWKTHGEELHAVWPEATEEANTLEARVHIGRSGEVFLRYMLFDYACSMEDILSGKAEWKPAFRNAE